MAVAQAQHRVRDLYDQLTKRGVDVKFAVHPVAGRMPGHMNVLLAEADIPYDRLVEMDDINPEMPQVGRRARHRRQRRRQSRGAHDKKSPIYGMPIIDADKAQTVLAIKRSMNPGFAGIENELYYARQHAHAVRRRQAGASATSSRRSAASTAGTDGLSVAG